MRYHYMPISSVQFSRSVVSDSLRPHESQHARPPCPSPTPGVHPNPCPLSRWCHPTISSSTVPSPPALNLSQDQGLFQWVSSLHRWPEYWSFSFNISPSNLSLRTDLLQNGLVGSPCSSRDSQEPSLTPQFKSINSSVVNILYGPILTSIHDYWKNHSFD